MPKHGYKCSGCDCNFDASSTIANRNEKTVCPKCGNLGDRDIEYGLNTCSAFDETTKEHTRWSWSMGVNPRQIPEMTRKYPGSNYNSKGQLEVIGRKDKLKKMKARGLVEFE
ncbi:MAG TPA: zinc ribbon domain-containing protein [bacterium]|nr:zinc ribbon domain-containing protein [bacterium]